jgi:GTP-binding protein EngB required for normal cell division
VAESQLTPKQQRGSEESDASFRSPRPFSPVEIGTALSDLASLLPSVQRPRVSELAARLTAGTIRLHISGQYKRGKSTLANALIGRQVLPYGVLPLTSLPTIVALAGHDELIIEYLNGRTERTVIGDLARYATEKENPSNRRGVARLRVTLASWTLPPYLEVVDTPGIGSVYVHNSAAATESLRDCDLALLVVSPEPPIGELEVAFLRTIAASSVWLAVAMNKADTVNPEAFQEITQFTAHVIQGVVERPIEIIPTTATSEDDQGIADLRRRIVLACNQRGQALLGASVARRARALAREAAALLRGEAAAARLPAEEARRSAEQLADALDAIELRRRDLKAVIDACEKRVIATLDEDINEFRSLATASLVDAVPSIAESTASLSEAEARLDERIAELAMTWRDREASKLSESLKGELEHFGRAAALFEHEARESAASIFGVDLSQRDATVELPDLPGFRLDFNEEHLSLQLGYRSMISLLPDPWRSRAFVRTLRERAIRFADRQCGRIRYDLLQRVREFISSTYATWNERYTHIVGSLRDMASEGQRAASAGSARSAAIADSCTDKADRLEELADIFASFSAENAA